MSWHHCKTWTDYSMPCPFHGGEQEDTEPRESRAGSRPRAAAGMVGMAKVHERISAPADVKAKVGAAVAAAPAPGAPGQLPPAIAAPPLEVPEIVKAIAKESVGLPRNVLYGNPEGGMAISPIPDTRKSSRRTTRAPATSVAQPAISDKYVRKGVTKNTSVAKGVPNRWVESLEQVPAFQQQMVDTVSTIHRSSSSRPVSQAKSTWSKAVVGETPMNTQEREAATFAGVAGQSMLMAERAFYEKYATKKTTGSLKRVTPWKGVGSKTPIKAAVMGQAERALADALKKGKAPGRPGGTKTVAGGGFHINYAARMLKLMSQYK